MASRVGVPGRELTIKQSLAILGGWLGLMIISFNKQRQKEAREKALSLENPQTDKRDDDKFLDRSEILKRKHAKYVVDHPLASWFLENAGVWFNVMTKLAVIGSETYEGTVANFFNLFAGFTIQERMGLLVQHIMVHHVYGHIPYFSEKGRPEIKSNEDIKDLVMEWLELSVTASVILSALKVNVVPADNASWTLRSDLGRLRFLPLAAKVAMMRTIVDVLFWCGHYAIHLKEHYWIHKRHHEHNNPHVLTNQHFSLLDLFIEAYIPVIVSTGILKALGIEMSVFEEALVSGYVISLEAYSHSGKPMPTSSMCAPISIIYNWILGFDFDRRNVEFHERHHNLLRCNYSITQWFDNLVGTTRF